MGRPELATDPRFATAPKRVENQAEAIRIIQDWLDRTPDDEALERMDRHRVPVAPVLSVGEAMQHPHLRQRRTVRTVPDPIVGQVELPGFPLRFSAFPDGLPVQAPTLGQHNLEVLEKYLGYSAERVKQLEAQNILVRKHC